MEGEDASYLHTVNNDNVYIHVMINKRDVRGSTNKPLHGRSLISILQTSSTMTLQPCVWSRSD